MLDKIKEAKRRFDETATNLLESDGHTFEDALNFFLGFCESDEVMTRITRPLKENKNVDFAKWHNDFLKSGGSLVGSGRFVLPTDENDRLSILYQLLLKTRLGEVNYRDFCIHAFGSLTFDKMAYSFNKAVSRPLIRGLLQRGEVLETEELSKQPSMTHVVSVRASKKFLVFIAYDYDTGFDFAKHLKQSLEKRSLAAFVATKDIGPLVNMDERWRETVDQVIATCNTFILILSTDRLSEEVAREVKQAIDRNKADPNFSILICHLQDTPRTDLQLLSTGIDLKQYQQ